MKVAFRQTASIIRSTVLIQGSKIYTINSLDIKGYRFTMVIFTKKNLNRCLSLKKCNQTETNVLEASAFASRTDG